MFIMPLLAVCVTLIVAAEAADTNRSLSSYACALLTTRPLHDGGVKRIARWLCNRFFFVFVDYTRFPSGVGSREHREIGGDARRKQMPVEKNDK